MARRKYFGVAKGVVVDVKRRNLRQLATVDRRLAFPESGDLIVVF